VRSDFAFGESRIEARARFIVAERRVRPVSAARSRSQKPGQAATLRARLNQLSFDQILLGDVPDAQGLIARSGPATGKPTRKVSQC